MSHLNTAYKLGADQAQQDFNEGVPDVGVPKVVPPPALKPEAPPTPASTPAPKPPKVKLPKPPKQIKPASMIYNEHNSVR